MGPFPAHYEPFSSTGAFVPATDEQRNAFVPQYAAIYDKIASAAQEVAKLDSAVAETTRDLQGAVEVERQLTDVLNRWAKPTFIDLWQQNRSKPNG